MSTAAVAKSLDHNHSHPGIHHLGLGFFMDVKCPGCLQAEPCTWLKSIPWHRTFLIGGWLEGPHAMLLDLLFVLTQQRFVKEVAWTI